MTVPLVAFEIESPQSFTAMCSACAGGTQDENFRSKVLSCADAGALNAASAAVANASAMACFFIWSPPLGAAGFNNYAA